MHDNVSSDHSSAISAPAQINPPAGIKMHKHVHVRIIILRTLLLLLFALGFFLSVFPTGRAVTRSLLALPELLSASQLSVLSESSEPIAHKQMTTTSAGGVIHLDVYAPVAPVPLLSRVRSGVLIISGVGDNRQEPQLINLLESLAHTGIVAMSLTTPILSSYTLSLLDVDSAVQAFKTLAQLPDMHGERIGIISISAGVALASLAAADPRIRAVVSYVVAFGGYFNVKSLLSTFGKRSQNIDGKNERWQPISIPIQVLGNTIGQNFSATESSILTNALMPGAAPLSAADLSQLSPAAAATYRLLSGTAPGDVAANIARLPAAIQVQLDALSPSSAIDKIQAPIFLLHDRNDPSMPVTETRAFAAALTRLHHPHEYIELHIFDHVSVRSDLNGAQLFGDGIQLFGMLNNLLSLAS